MSLPILPPKSDYKLPGDIANPNSLKVRNHMLQMAYGRRFNPRLLEYIFYAPWNQLFSSLVYDNPDILLVPQHTVYRERGDDSPPNNSNVSVMTKPLQNVDIRIPDFGMLRVASTPGDVTPPWNEVSIETQFVCLLSEIKRPPSRSISDPKRFTVSLQQKLDAARSELYLATAIIFANPKLIHQPQSLILVAVSGEWYSWTELSRHHFPDLDASKKNWLVDVWPTRDLHRKPTKPCSKKTAEDKRGKKSGAKKNQDNSDKQDEYSGEVEGDSDEETDKFDDKTANSNKEKARDVYSEDAGHNEEEHLSDVEDVINFVQQNLGEEEQENTQYDGDKDVDDEHDLDYIYDYFDDQEVPGQRDSDSEYSDEESDEKRTGKPLITEYHHCIVEDPNLSHLRDEDYEQISMKKGEPMKIARATWTKFIRLGTPVSNQHLAAIHERLQEIRPHLPRTDKPMPNTAASSSGTKHKTARQKTSNVR